MRRIVVLTQVLCVLILVQTNAYSQEIRGEITTTISNTRHLLKEDVWVGWSEPISTTGYISVDLHKKKINSNFAMLQLNIVNVVENKINVPPNYKMVLQCINSATNDKVNVTIKRFDGNNFSIKCEYKKNMFVYYFYQTSGSLSTTSNENTTNQPIPDAKESDIKRFFAKKWVTYSYTQSNGWVEYSPLQDCNILFTMDPNKSMIKFYTVELEYLIYKTESYVDDSGNNAIRMRALDQDNNVSSPKNSTV